MFKKFIPNLFTLTNLSFGIFSILEIINKDYLYAAMLIIIAAIIDRYAGRSVRFFNIDGELGKELGSLVNLVSFGVAPGFLIFAKYNLFDLGYMGTVGVSFVLAYILSSAYRLAKYNISEFKGIFTDGLIIVSGSTIALFSLITSRNTVSRLLSIVLMVVFTYLMLSNFKFKKYNSSKIESPYHKYNS